MAKELSPVRNELPRKTHDKTKKSQKNSPPGVSLQGTTFQSGFGQPESLQERRRVRFGNRTLPLILPAQCVCRLRLQVLSHEFESTGRRFDPRRGSAEPRSLLAGLSTGKLVSKFESENTKKGSISVWEPNCELVVLRSARRRQHPRPSRTRARPRGVVGTGKRSVKYGKPNPNVAVGELNRNRNLTRDPKQNRA